LGKNKGEATLEKTLAKNGEKEKQKRIAEKFGNYFNNSPRRTIEEQRAPPLPPPPPQTVARNKCLNNKEEKLRDAQKV